MNRRGQIVDTSHSGGKTVAQKWCELFALNEQLYREGKRVMDDDDITVAMYLAFPDRILSAIFKEVNKVRRRYNKGKLAGMAGPPAVPSWKYKNLNGRAQRVNSRGYPLPENQQREGT